MDTDMYSRLRMSDPGEASRYSLLFSTFYVYPQEVEASDLYNVNLTTHFDPDFKTVATEYVCSARQLIDLIENEFKSTNVLFWLSSFYQLFTLPTFLQNVVLNNYWYLLYK